MKRVVATGRTIEDAVTSALVRLGATRSQATVRVIKEPVKGWFGFIGSKDAEVEVSVQMTPEETAKDFLAGVLTRMGIEWRIRTREEKDGGELAVVLDVSADEDVLPVLIGKHGSTLDSLQYLVNVVANHDNAGHTKFVVDAGDYRRRRREGLWKLAERSAERAIRTRKPVSLDAMPATDRKVIHMHLQDRLDVTTSSEGMEPNRKVVIIPVVGSGAGVRPQRQRRQTGRRGESNPGAPGVAGRGPGSGMAGIREARGGPGREAGTGSRSAESAD